MSTEVSVFLMIASLAAHSKDGGLELHVIIAGIC